MLSLYSTHECCWAGDLLLNLYNLVSVIRTSGELVLKTQELMLRQYYNEEAKINNLQISNLKVYNSITYSEYSFVDVSEHWFGEILTLVATWSIMRVWHNY